MSRIKLVIFDIAGTIIEDHGEVVHAFAAALQKNGIAFTEDELKKWKGASKREVIRHFAGRGGADNEQLVETTYQSFRVELEHSYDRELRPIAGAETTFAWCREHQITMATTTGFYSEISGLILKRIGWKNLFAANISSNDVKQGRPAPDMILRAMEQTGIGNAREVMNVGDTPLDLQAGTNGGAGAVVGVLTGAHTREELEREPHTHIIESIAELPDLICRF